MPSTQFFTTCDRNSTDKTTQPPLRDPGFSMLKDQYIHPTSLARFLRHCQRPGAAPYIHPKALSYLTKANKDNWRMAFAGAADLDTYWQFWSTCSTANTQVALFSTWTAT